MTEPTQEQIEAWHDDATMGTKVLDLPHFARCAYAAGRKAGIPSAEQLTQILRGSGYLTWSHARECADMIRAAMEADK
ncbi:MAG: hypothetical protein KGL42_17280 [Betaproteobacteria bacterium]|nr:hypothetical protein [Betaproteobacteria bacterium]